MWFLVSWFVGEEVKFHATWNSIPRLTDEKYERIINEVGCDHVSSYQNSDGNKLNFIKFQMKLI